MADTLDATVVVVGRAVDRDDPLGAYVALLALAGLDVRNPAPDTFLVWGTAAQRTPMILAHQAASGIGHVGALCHGGSRFTFMVQAR